MATYKGIQGYSVQTLASDPTAADVEGQLWYNSTSGAFKIAVAAAGAWASGGSLNSAHGQMGCVGGTPGALVMGGGPSAPTVTESYNGSTWATVNAMNTGRQYSASFGSTTAAVAVAGNPSSVTTTETWDGTSWTDVPGVLSAGRQKFGTSNNGSTTAGLIFAGQNSPGPPWYSLALVESWDGTSWTAETAVTTDREAGGGVGIQTASLCITGYDQNPPSGMRDHVEEWNGTAWTEKNNVNTARQAVCCSGTTTTALIGGGTPTPKALVEQWNGTSWTEVADLATAREGLGKGAGATGNTCIAVGGDGTGNQATEEWSGAPVTAKTVTVS